jgi:hypothetical protein
VGARADTVSRVPGRLIVAAVAAAALLVLTGFANGPVLTREGYIARADTICRKAIARVLALPKPENAGALAAYAEKALAIATRQLTDVRQLQPPARDRAAVARIVAASERELEAFRKLIADFRAGEDAALAADNARLVKTAQVVSRLARSYGFRHCGQMPIS